MGGASKLLMLLFTPIPRLYRPAPSALRLPLSRPLSTASGRRLLPYPRRPILSLRAGATEKLHTQTQFSEPFPSLSKLEWSTLVNHLVSVGYSERRVLVPAGDDDDCLVGYDGLPENFLKAAEVCLAFARDRPDVLRLLSRKDIEVVVENCSPSLFKNGMNSVRRMRAFLSGDEIDVLQTEGAQTVDLMRYLVSYAQGLLNINGNSEGKELIETSIRNLLTELVNAHGVAQISNVGSTSQIRPLSQGQFSRPPRQNIEMKRGDWICPKCSFMNFARNMKCLECDEARPNRQLTGGEWECPQCDFFNYGRNMSCLRCDCKRPVDSPLNSAAPGGGGGYRAHSNIEQILNGKNGDTSEIERRLAANDEKAERWFSKVSQLDDASDLSSAIADEDFPEIMPLRKGTNRFVVSTRKTPLERRLADEQYRRNLEDGASGKNTTTESSISESLDRILGRSSATPRTTDQSTGGGSNSSARSRFNSSDNRQSISRLRDPDYVPFVPLPSDMFQKSPKSDNVVQQSSDKEDSSVLKTDQPSGSTDTMSRNGGSGAAFPSQKFQGPSGNGEDRESSEVLERWHKKVAELDDVSDLASAIPDEDFPEIMPMRKGENRFVVSKKKDRSLTSPQYKRRLAMEQSNNSNFVPFVPFPPDYFAKKDKQPEAVTTSADAATGTSSSNEKSRVESPAAPELDDTISGENQHSSGNFNKESYGTNSNESMINNVYPRATVQSVGQSNNYHNGKKENWSSEIPQKSDAFDGPTSVGSPPRQADNPQNARESWNYGISGKSLEGSAVKEPDPLDMSEEAKAERWFRRAAQIKDISELSQIPDEDFPEIMPMRKGVNRFVVSKRKTPLERRLTSAQYRRNLPIVSSEPKKDSN
ncbi:Ran binding protein zinc finger-like protein [Dioscorea alata]|uniref:Ran binding protein zinc finger-like protein n=1 Tax=Dioscorea alata TaxID=55571 RepID=A0ACB7VF32_DIOAL|nr:Ran binding protein zinc finger-like protein [Dioscorea alata]